MGIIDGYLGEDHRGHSDVKVRRSFGGVTPVDHD
jgi:hypothetical protein